MFGLRQKLLMGFGGLLLILLAVGALSILVLRQYSGALQKFLAENYRSVEYAQVMKDQLERLDDAAERALAADADLRSAKAAAAQARDEFEKNRQLENRNVTLHPREDQMVGELNGAWARYDAALAIVLDASRPADARRDALKAT